MVPVPSDFFVENVEAGQFYQQCLPQVFRYISSVAFMDEEIIALFNGSRPATTDQWETLHIQSMTADFGEERQFLRNAGYGTIFAAEDLAKFNGNKEYPSTYGYWDEDSLEYLWKYVDHTTSRKPKNRMYIGWMDSTSHTPFILPPFWKNNVTFYHEETAWASVNSWLNSLRWTDDIVKEIILGFRERGLEDETLFVMYARLSETALT